MAYVILLHKYIINKSILSGMSEAYKQLNPKCFNSNKQYAVKQFN